MAKRNKKVLKLRAYRDKLIGIVTNLEGTVRGRDAILLCIRKALQQDDTLRAYALASESFPHNTMLEHFSKNELVKELTLVYRFLSIERNYTDELRRAADGRDYLRVAALTADHMAESKAHDKILEQLSKEGFGFTRSLRDENNETIV